MATAITFGLRQALDEPKDEAAVVQHLDDDLFGLDPDEPIDLHVEWGSPQDSWVVMRPWLLCRDGMWCD